MKTITHFKFVMLVLISISFKLNAQSISYPVSSYSEPLGTTITSVSPILNGKPYCYAISPNLKTNTGLLFDTSTGIISGTPTIASGSTIYTVTANFGGLQTKTTTIAIGVPGLSISYTGSTFTYTTGTAITPLAANTSGASPVSYSTSPNITAVTGLTFDTSTGQISGTPSKACAATTFAITAIYSSYTATSTINICVNGFNYPGSSYTLSKATNGQAAILISPIINSLPVNAKFSITSGTLPQGLSLTGTTNSTAIGGTITGVPTTTFTSPTTVTVTAKNSSNTTILATNTVTFMYSDKPVAILSYPTFPVTIYAGSIICAAPVVLQSTTFGGTFYSITSGSLPTGLTLNSNTGVISGYPSTTTKGGFPVTITYTYGSLPNNTASSSFTIDVEAPTISYPGSTFTCYMGMPFSSIAPNITAGGTPTGYTISPDITANTGLCFNSITGVISGTATKAKGGILYTVTANYNATSPILTTASTGVAIISIGTNYPATALTFTLGRTIPPVLLNKIGTLINNNPYSISPNLTYATGLTFDTSTGIISGTPTKSACATNYTVTAVFLTGTATASVNIAVVAGINTWTGKTNTDWNKATNWSTGVVPTIFTSVNIPTTINKPIINSASFCASINITGNTIITLNAGLTASEGLNINSGASLTLAGTGSAIFNGNSNFGSAGTLTIGSANTVSFPSSSAIVLNDGNGVSNTTVITNNGKLNLTSATLMEGISASINNIGTLNFSNTSVYLSNPLSGNSLTNSGIITANNKSVFTINDEGVISNTGTFFAGTSNSSCILNLGGSSSNITNTGNFVMGPTSTINLTGTGATVVTTAGQFILMSDANNSASIGQITGLGAGFTGQYYVQRYMSGNNSLTYRNYRALSSPVNAISATSGSTNYSDLSFLNQDFTPDYSGAPTYNGIYTGGPGAGFSFTNANPLIYLYNETLNPTNPSDTFYLGKNVGITSISGTNLGWKSTATDSTQNGTTQLPAGNGFLLYYLGSTTHSTTSTDVSPDNAVVTYNGYLNQSDVPVNLWYTPQADSVAGTSGTLSYSGALNASGYAGYNLVGNPYASTIDLAAVYGDNQSGFTTFYELTDAAPQSYVSYNANTGATSSASASEYVESGQGFFVVATAAGQSLTFKEDQKISDTTLLTSSATQPGLLAAQVNRQPYYNGLPKRANKKSDINLSGMHLMLKNDNENFHETGIYFSKDWSDDFDRNDAVDMDGIAPKLFLSSYTQNNIRTSINSMGSYADGKKIKLYVAGIKDGNYTLFLSDIKNIDTSAYKVFLLDEYKKDSVDFAKTRNYRFDISNSDKGSFGSDRLILSITRKAIPGYELLSFAGAKANKGILLSWITNNEGSNTSFQVQKLDAKTNQYTIVDLLESNGSGNYSYTDNNVVNGNNTYRLAQIVNNNTTYSQPVTIVYNNTISQGLINVYPNPASETLTVDFSTVVKSGNDNYMVNIYNSMGMLITEKSVNTSVLSQNVNALQSGTYVIQVKSNNGSVLGNAKFIKK